MLLPLLKYFVRLVHGGTDQWFTEIPNVLNARVFRTTQRPLWLSGNIHNAKSSEVHKGSLVFPSNSTSRVSDKHLWLTHYSKENPSRFWGFFGIQNQLNAEFPEMLRGSCQFPYSKLSAWAFPSASMVHLVPNVFNPNDSRQTSAADPIFQIEPKPCLVVWDSFRFIDAAFSSDILCQTFLGCADFPKKYWTT